MELLKLIALSLLIFVLFIGIAILGATYPEILMLISCLFLLAFMAVFCASILLGR